MERLLEAFVEKELVLYFKFIMLFFRNRVFFWATFSCLAMSFSFYLCRPPIDSLTQSCLKNEDFPQQEVFQFKSIGLAHSIFSGRFATPRQANLELGPKGKMFPK